MNFPIWIIEVPHQLPARGWKCEDEAALRNAAYKAAEGMWCEPGVFVFETPEEYAEWLGVPVDELSEDRTDLEYSEELNVGFPLACINGSFRRATDAHRAPDANARAYIEMLAQDLHGVVVCRSLADLIEVALEHEGHQDLRVRAIAACLIADEIDSDWAMVQAALSGYEANSDKIRRVRDALAKPLAEYRAAKAVRDAERAKRVMEEAARQAAYERRVADWRASLDASVREKMDALLAAGSAATGKRRKALRRKLRDLEKAHGRP